MKIPTNTQKAVIGLIIYLVAYGLFNESDYQQEQKKKEEDCDMYQTWLNDTFNRVPVDQRNGRPTTVKNYEARGCPPIEQLNKTNNLEYNYGR